MRVCVCVCVCGGGGGGGGGAQIIETRLSLHTEVEDDG